MAAAGATSGGIVHGVGQPVAVGDFLRTIVLRLVVDDEVGVPLVRVALGGEGGLQVADVHAEALVDLAFVEDLGEVEQVGAHGVGEARGLGDAVDLAVEHGGVEGHGLFGGDEILVTIQAVDLHEQRSAAVDQWTACHGVLGGNAVGDGLVHDGHDSLAELAGSVEDLVLLVDVGGHVSSVSSSCRLVSAWVVLHVVGVGEPFLDHLCDQDVAFGDDSHPLVAEQPAVCNKSQRLSLDVSKLELPSHPHEVNLDEAVVLVHSGDMELSIAGNVVDQETTGLDLDGVAVVKGGEKEWRVAKDHFPSSGVAVPLTVGVLDDLCFVGRHIFWPTGDLAEIPPEEEFAPSSAAWKLVEAGDLDAQSATRC